MAIEYNFIDIYHYVAWATRGNGMWRIPINTSGQAIDPVDLPAPDLSRPSINAARSLMWELIESLGLTKPKGRHEAEQFFVHAAAKIFQKALPTLPVSSGLTPLTKEEIRHRDDDANWTLVRCDVVQRDGVRQWFASPAQGNLLYELNQHMLVDDHDGAWFAWVPALDNDGNAILREPGDAIWEYASINVLYWMTYPKTPGQWRLGWQTPHPALRWIHVQPT